mmetsp:Transcript_6810/g.12636  ORF Transcript_6810/g.12636 Transcript_6810/m.12636 type:complete len:215 (+) Transcript_6810:123-767(+)|eukprot:CAMPEP_0171751692 /NCGR_PEP_ID=MMETSP0991-20121206/42163_1 /TAXON_ID=483369 /ORGANISM="non described non described, Strain CCMP2098" /LENGTH=214 /DNA_ID=CAMNT_0012352915 /DNA_START=90 /DNA_END=734 /DNA_ORIENTATION=-
MISFKSLFSTLVLHTVVAELVAPEYFEVSFETNVFSPGGSVMEPIVLAVTRSWSPYGADRFYALIQDSYYDDAAFFRVVPDFVVQWGIAALPNMTSKWDTPIPDDPVLQSNCIGYVSYAAAGPDTRTSQIFINYINNTGLDSQGFAPFAKVTSGMATAEAIVNPTPGDSNGISQAGYTHGGNAWLLPKYPDVSLITEASFVGSNLPSKAPWAMP